MFSDGQVVALETGRIFAHYLAVKLLRHLVFAQVKIGDLHLVERLIVDAPVLVCGASHVESPALDKHEAIGRRCHRKSSNRHKANKCASENSGKHYFNFP